MLLPSPVFLFHPPLPPPPHPLLPADPGCTSVWMGHTLLQSLFSISFSVPSMCLAGESVGCAGGSSSRPHLACFIRHQEIHCGVFKTLSKETACCCVMDDLSGESGLGQLSTGSRCFSHVQRACGCWPDGGRLLSSQGADSCKQIEHFSFLNQIAAHQESDKIPS